MTSILTNVSAISAGQKLRDVNYNLEVVQDRVSSGLRVADSADNAAYWSIAKIMKSDNAALSAVSDAMGLGSSKVDIAKAGMEKTIEVISNIKSKLVAAIEHGTDSKSVQEEINHLQEQLKGIASGASFNGENWLQANLGSPNAVVTKSVVSSFVRGNDGNCSVTNIDYHLDSSSVLFDVSNKEEHYGILDRKASYENVSQSLQNVSLNVVGSDGKQKKINLRLATTSGAWLKGAGATFDQEKGVAVVGDRNNNISNGIENNVNANANDAAKDKGVYLRIAEDLWALGTFDRPSDSANNSPLIQAQHDGKDYYVDIKKNSLDNNNSYNVSLDYSVTNFNITKHSNTDMYTETTAIQKMLSFVDRQLKNVTVAAGKIGSISSRIHLQEDFVQFMRNSIEKGIGRLLDADMAAESSKLAALQTQQQLAIQALSIANSSSQRTLSLFR